MGAPRSDYEHPSFARTYVRLAEAADARGASEHRRRLLADLSGTVLEVGAGHGASFAHYPATVARVVALEPEPTLRGHAVRAARSAATTSSMRPGWTSMPSRRRTRPKRSRFSRRLDMPRHRAGENPVGGDQAGRRW